MRLSTPNQSGRTVHMVVVVCTVLQCIGDELEFEQVASSAIVDNCLRADVQVSQPHVNVR